MLHGLQYSARAYVLQSAGVRIGVGRAFDGLFEQQRPNAADLRGFFLRLTVRPHRVSQTMPNGSLLLFAASHRGWGMCTWRLDGVCVLGAWLKCQQIFKQCPTCFLTDFT